MLAMTRWLDSRGFVRSRFSELPVRPDTAEAGLHHWFVLTGGLALILSRARPVEIAERFAATRELYLLLRDRGKNGPAPQPGAELLNDVLHEIATVADPLTKASAQACFRAALQQHGPQPAGAAAAGAPSTRGGAASTLRSTRSAASDHPQTQVSVELFEQRSSTLRQTVAAHRSTTPPDRS